MDLSSWSQLLSQLSQLPTLFTQVANHDDRISSLEKRMATQEATIARLNSVTNAYAEDITAITQQIKDLRDALASGNQAAVSAAMDSLDPSIAGLEAMQTNLRGLGANPTEPVPAPVTV